MKTHKALGWGVRIDGPRPYLDWFIGSEAGAESQCVDVTGRRPAQVVLLPLDEFRRLERLEQAELAEKETAQKEPDIRGVIKEALKNYGCQHNYDQYGDHLQLLDALSPGHTIAEGKQEIDLLADDIAVAIDESHQADSPEMSERQQGEQVLDTVKAFMQEQKISCAETIWQCDRVILNAYDFIRELCEAVGYYEYPEEDHNDFAHK